MWFENSPTCEDGGLVGLLTVRSGKRFFPSSWLPLGLCCSGFSSRVGGRQNARFLLLQSLHCAAQLLNGSCFGGQLLVEALYSHSKRCLGLALLSAGTWLGLQGKSHHLSGRAFSACFHLVIQSSHLCVNVTDTFF